MMGFPRTLIEGDVPFNARKAARRLESGLPWGVTVDLAVAAIDRNWANWIRPGQGPCRRRGSGSLGVRRRHRHVRDRRTLDRHDRVAGRRGRDRTGGLRYGGRELTARTSDALSLTDSTLNLSANLAPARR